MSEITEENKAIIRAQVNEEMINFIINVRETYRNSSSRYHNHWATEADKFLNKIPENLSGLVAFHEQLSKHL